MLKKILNIKNIATKILLWLIGFAIILSQNYTPFLVGFLLTDKEIKIEPVSYTLLTAVGLAFILGGWRLNTIIKKVLGTKKNIENEI